MRYRERCESTGERVWKSRHGKFVIGFEKERDKYRCERLVIPVLRKGEGRGVSDYRGMRNDPTELDEV